MPNPNPYVQYVAEMNAKSVKDHVQYKSKHQNVINVIQDYIRKICSSNITVRSIFVRSACHLLSIKCIIEYLCRIVML